MQKEEETHGAVVVKVACDSDIDVVLRSVILDDLRMAIGYIVEDLTDTDCINVYYMSPEFDAERESMGVCVHVPKKINVQEFTEALNDEASGFCARWRTCIGRSLSYDVAYYGNEENVEAEDI